ncbi:response regulator transcription factor [Streptomyces antimycoticus]|uniref:response regulator transcription factor n=1 Tax=Streptomyces antimycoticus TaxID=68175 RepID=UPI0037D381E7
MTQPLTDVRILVADDQKDVARTLCRPLQKAGARLHYVTDGQAALDQMANRPYDLVLIDMKMPPGEWGGLWLLQQMKTEGWSIPSLVLSGEGSKQQVIEALRLNAQDWIIKDDTTDLLERCASILTEHHQTSLETATHQLPTPLSYRFNRYARTADAEKKLIEGLHTLESILRFAAAIGLASTPPTPLKGITAEQLAAPSMGTWFALCTALAKVPNAGENFTRTLSWLVPEPSDHQRVQNLIALRNDLAHGRETSQPTQGEHLHALLTRFAHRANCAWQPPLVTPTSMTYDGTRYFVDVLNLKGATRPTPETVSVPTSVITGQPLLIAKDGAPTPLAPWLVTPPGESPGAVSCLLFDGLQRTKGAALSAVTPFRYTKTNDGEDSASATHPQGVWPTLEKWIAASATGPAH